jgi:hypothetical protein
MDKFDNEERIFGPFTFKQLGIVFFGVAISFYVKMFVVTFLTRFPISPLLLENVDILVFIITAIIVIKLVINNKPPTLDREYIEKKKYLYTNTEDFKKWLESKIRTRQNEIALRNSKGMVPDNRLEQELRDLQQVFDKEKNN